MTEVADFFDKVVEGYLLKDLSSLMAVSPGPGEVAGAVGYPIVLTVFAGVELLGTLRDALSGDPSSFSTNTERYFEAFWGGVVYAGQPARAAAGPGLYKLARNGLAHVYLTKGPFEVTKGPAGRSRHLTKASDGTVSINCDQLVEDFREAYNRFRVEALDAAAARRIALRLDAMGKLFAGTAARTAKDLDLPAPLPSQSQGPVVPGYGPTFKSQT